MADSDPFNLKRFIEAQEPVFETALQELKTGRKRSHWMWFVFPQIRGLGSSSMAQIYAIGSLDEARAFLAHPLLGPRLAACAESVLDVKGRSLHEIFGSPDHMKFCSSMTLFAQADGGKESAFQKALDRYCGGRADERTLRILYERAS